MVDSVMIRLFDSTATSFDSNGLGSLADATSCTVTEERNGEFELEMEYPITGYRYSDIELRCIIVTKPNPYDDPQPFRIYSISRPIDGIVTINAQHISYDLSGYPVSAFTASGIQEALVNMVSACAVDCPFTFSSDKSTSATMTVSKPASMRSLLGGTDGSLLDIYGGEYEFNGYKVILHNHRGSDRGVTIRYGKNLTDIKQEENCSSVYTGVYPFWYSEDDGLVELEEKIVEASGTYNYTRIYTLDLSDEWTEAPTEDELREKAEAYIEENDIGVPSVSIEVSFTQLAQSEEYQDYALLETVYLCDTVIVEFPELNVSATAKCVSTTYDVLTNKYTSLELGESRTNLADTVTSQSEAISETSTKTFMELAIENATKLITGGLGGYVILHSSTGGKTPDEILIMDTDDITTATQVWRWNKGGLGYSSTGYNGPYGTAITMDGQIVADYVATGTMQANRIKGGVLTLGGEDGDSGVCQVLDADGNVLVQLDENGIKAILGEIAGWEITENQLKSSNGLMTINSSTRKITCGDTNGVQAMYSEIGESICLDGEAFGEFGFRAIYWTDDEGNVTSDLRGYVLAPKVYNNDDCMGYGIVAWSQADNQYQRMMFYDWQEEWFYFYRPITALAITESDPYWVKDVVFDDDNQSFAVTAGRGAYADTTYDFTNTYTYTLDSDGNISSITNTDNGKVMTVSHKS